MISSIKSELRKLLTVRSTYMIFAISFALGALLIGFWVFGHQNVDNAQRSSGALMGALLSCVSTVGVLLSFIAVLLVGHEYRHNTIMYSLTNVNSRRKFFAAKYIALVAFSLLYAAIITLSCWILFYVGLQSHGIHPMAQHVPIGDILWRSVATIVGDVSFAFIIAFLVRNLIGAIAVVLVLPTTIESLLGLLLKDNVKYLPYTAVGNFSNVESTTGHLFSLNVVLAYMIVGGAVAYILFLKRDAN